MADVGVGVWENPPQRRRAAGSGQWAPFIEELKGRPEQWGRLSVEFEEPRAAQAVASNLRVSARSGKYLGSKGQPTTGDHWAFVSRTPEPDGGVSVSYVFGSYWPDGKPTDVHALEAGPRTRGGE